MTIKLTDIIATLSLSADQLAAVDAALAAVDSMEPVNGRSAAQLVAEERTIREDRLTKAIAKRLTDRDCAKAVAKIETADLAAAASEVRRSQKARKIEFARAYAAAKAAQVAAAEGRTHDAAVLSADV